MLSKCPHIKVVGGFRWIHRLLCWYHVLTQVKHYTDSLSLVVRSCACGKLRNWSCSDKLLTCLPFTNTEILPLFTSQLSVRLCPCLQLQQYQKCDIKFISCSLLWSEASLCNLTHIVWLTLNGKRLGTVVWLSSLCTFYQGADRHLICD